MPTFYHEKFPNYQQVSRRVPRSGAFYLHRQNDPQARGAYTGLHQHRNALSYDEKS